MDADIGVIGIGTMGSMAMWQLASKGASVIGFEQYGIGHDRSAAGGETRIFRTAYQSGLEYIPILKEAKELWKQLESETKNHLYTKTSGLAIGNPQIKSMKNMLESIKEFDLDHEILAYEEAKKRFPQHKLLHDEIVILDKEAGFLRPQYAIVSAVQRAEELGAIVHSYTRVEEVCSEGNGVRVRADGKDYMFGQVLISTGPWAREFLPDFEQQIEVRRLVNTWFTSKNLSLFTPDKFPVFQRETNGVIYYGFPTVDGASVKIAISSHKKDKINGPNDINRTVEIEELSTIRQTIRDFLPDLYPDPIRVSAYMEGYTPDGHSIVGRLPNEKNIVVACGFSGHGFKMAPAIGKITADILLENETTCSIDHLSPIGF
ncbi:N-methyl-L-tryptophan oxidase [Bacillus sp. 03113]|uniref:N-methyl-L-tryptophan oxidase n=1 Tax=Bacillus sp. 03113 TaxID=2578211 RepID=UPI0011413E2D|nr:N-methyl-L-tryptophan oxidase [Bacillus sp. 03113]